MILECKYEVNAAHRLTAGVPAGHPCRRLHGHRYNITVGLKGEINPETGMILEYADIDERVWEVLSFVDHRFLNELDQVQIAGVELREKKKAADVSKNSTVEHFAVWLKAELEQRFNIPGLPDIAFVRIEEDAGHTVQL